MTTYIRRALDDGAQFIIQTDADRWEPPPSRIPFWTAVVAFIGIIAASIPGGIVLAFIVAFIVHRVLRRVFRRKPKTKGTVIVVTPAEVRWPDGAVLPAGDVREVLWRDWSVGRSDGNYGVYVELKKGPARTIDKGFEGAVAHRLANEIAEILNVSADEAFANRVVPPPKSGGGFPGRLEDYLTPAEPVSQAPNQPAERVWSPHEPRPGDILLKETGRGAFELRRVTQNGSEHWKDVPQGGLIDAVMFTHASAGDRDTWIEKLVDAGQPSRLPKLSQPGEPV
jgi:hypothetical protein